MKPENEKSPGPRRSESYDHSEFELLIRNSIPMEENSPSDAQFMFELGVARGRSESEGASRPPRAIWFRSAGFWQLATSASLLLAALLYLNSLNVESSMDSVVDKAPERSATALNEDVEVVEQGKSLLERSSVSGLAASLTPPPNLSSMIGLRDQLLLTFSRNDDLDSVFDRVHSLTARVEKKRVPATLTSQYNLSTAIELLNGGEF